MPSAWIDALMLERSEKAKLLFNRLDGQPWQELSHSDRIKRDLLGWFCLEIDTEPEIDLEDEP